ncbi:MAG: hypothetical protein MJ227_04630 [Bacilli bacterium]|nr:hypothetical protein [Bacilli bacterium]
MPNCKNCHARITKFDTDICPVCGCKNPLEGVTSETVEITSQLDANNPKFKLYRPRLKYVTFMFFVFIGFTGAGFFYMYKKKMGLIWLVANLVFIAAVGSLFAFLSPLGILWSYLIMLFITYAVNIIVGCVYIARHNIKDGHGEFMK